MKIIPKVQW